MVGTIPADPRSLSTVVDASPDTYTGVCSKGIFQGVLPGGKDCRSSVNTLQLPYSSSSFTLDRALEAGLLNLAIKSMGRACRAAGDLSRDNVEHWPVTSTTSATSLGPLCGDEALIHSSFLASRLGGGCFW